MDTESFVLGAAIGGAVLFSTGFLKKAGEDFYSLVKKKIKPNSISPGTQPLIVHIDHTSAGNNQSEHSVENTPQASTLTIREIDETIQNAPPLQRNTLAANFLGIRVAWNAIYRGGRLLEKDMVRVHLTAINAGKNYRSVFCEVSLVDYRMLGVLPEDSKIWVSGEIESLDNDIVMLKNANLQINYHA